MKKRTKAKAVDKRITFSELLLTLFSVAISFVMMTLLYITVTYAEDTNEYDGSESNIAMQDTNYIYVRDSLGSGFLNAIEACNYFGSTEQIVNVPCDQVVREEGAMASVAKIFASVELEMFALVPVCVSAGIDADMIEITDYRITDDRVEYIPESQIIGTSVAYDSVEMRFEEGHVRNTSDYVMSFTENSVATACEVAYAEAVGSGLLEIAQENARTELRRLLMALGVENVEVVSRSDTNYQVVYQGRYEEQEQE